MRTGKIAKLPSQIRDELNYRMSNTEDGKVLLDWLNGLPEVQEALNLSFEGAAITKQNLYEWRRGGFREWQIKQELIDGACQLSSSVREMEDVIDLPLVAGHLVSMIAVRYASVLNAWDGEVTPEITEKLRLLGVLTRDLALIQRTTSHAFKQKNDYHQHLEKESKESIGRARHAALSPIWAIFDRQRWAKLLGGGEAGEKLAEVIVAIQRGLPLPEEPTEDCAVKAGKTQ